MRTMPYAPRLHHLLILSATSCLLLALVGRARADDARAAFAAGKAAYAAGIFAEASEAFERAYALRPAAGVLFNLAQAQRKAGHCARAAETYRRFLQAPTSEARAAAEAGLAESEACAAQQAPPAPAPAVVEPALSPGVASAPDPSLLPTTPTSDEGAATPATRPDVVDLPPAGVQDHATGRGRRLRRLGLVTGGVGAVALGAGLIGYFSSAVICTDKCDEPGEERTQREHQTAWLALGVGGGLASAAGVGLYVWGYLINDAEPRLGLSPTRGGMVASTTFRF